MRIVLIQTYYIDGMRGILNHSHRYRLKQKTNKYDERVLVCLLLFMHRIEDAAVYS